MNMNKVEIKALATQELEVRLRGQKIELDSLTALVKGLKKLRRSEKFDWQKRINALNDSINVMELELCERHEKIGILEELKYLKEKNQAQNNVIQELNSELVRLRHKKK